MSPTGTDTGTCLSTAGACRTIGYAYRRSAPGDVVKVAAGFYDRQAVRGRKAAPGVVFDMDPASHFSNVDVEATWVEFRNGQIDNYGWWTEARDPVPSNITFKNIAARAAAFNGGRDIVISGGSIGAGTSAAGVPAAVMLHGEGVGLSNVVIDDIDFHDLDHATSSDHFEAVRIDGGARDVTIRRSRFRNITANTSLIFITNVYDDARDPRNLTFENNFFSEPLKGPGGGAYFAINMHANVGTCETFAFRYNSFAGPPALLECATKSNVSWIGNLAPKQPGCAGNTFSRNVWQSTSASTRCSASDKWVNGPQNSSSRLGFVDAARGDLHLTDSSPAKDAGDAAIYPPTDIDRGDRSSSRPPDAGADEAGVSGACSRRVSAVAAKRKQKSTRRSAKRCSCRTRFIRGRRSTAASSASRRSVVRASLPGSSSAVPRLGVPFGDRVVRSRSAAFSTSLARPRSCKRRARSS